MADVLSVIREYNVSKKNIEDRDNLAIFGDKAWQKTAKTNFVAYGYVELNVTRWQVLEQLIWQSPVGWDCGVSPSLSITIRVSLSVWL